MDKKLKKSDIEYLHILHIIWQLVDYYSKLFQIIIGNDPTKIPVRLYKHDGITHLTFTFQKVQNTVRDYTVLEMKDILNEYLRYVLLPNQLMLFPYHNGNNLYDYLEPLYVDLVYEDSGYINLDVIYVDNLLAYKHVRNKEDFSWIQKNNY